MKTEEIYDDAVSVLKSRLPGLQAVYQFGSTVSGRERLESDIDLAFLAFKKVDEIERWNIQEELARMFLRDVDLIDLKSTTDVMKFQIISTGNRIFTVDINKSEHFETLVYSMYLDLNEQRKEILNEFKVSGNIYG